MSEPMTDTDHKSKLAEIQARVDAAAEEHESKAERSPYPEDILATTNAAQSTLTVGEGRYLLERVRDLEDSIAKLEAERMDYADRVKDPAKLIRAKDAVIGSMVATIAKLESVAKAAAAVVAWTAEGSLHKTDDPSIALRQALKDAGVGDVR